MGYILTGDQMRTVYRKLGEIQRQLGQAEYPYDPERLILSLQGIVEGQFWEMDGQTKTSDVPRLILDPRRFQVVLYPAMSFGTLLEDGKYDRKSDDFTPEHFPLAALSAKTDRELLLVQINVTVTGPEAESILEAAGYTLAGT